MKSLVKAGLLITGMLTLLVACGGGGGGTVAPPTPPTVTVTADKNTAVASGNDAITLSATFVPAQLVGTDVTFSIPSASNAYFVNGLKTFSTKVLASPANTAQAILYSPINESVTVTAASQGGTGTSSALTYGNGVSSYSSFVNALGPVFVVASDASLTPGTSVVNFTASGAGTIRVFDGTWTNTGAYAPAASAPVALGGTFPGKAVVYLRCDSAGPVTVTATAAGSGASIGSVTTDCFAQTTTSLNVHLTSSGVAKLGSKLVGNIRFNMVAGASSNTTSIVTHNSSFTVTVVEQKTAVSTFVSLSPGGAVLNSVTPLFTATYAFNPALPSFSVLPFETVTFTDGSTPLTLTSTDFEIR